MLSNGQLEIDQNNILSVIDEEINNKLQKPARHLDAYEQYFSQCQEQNDPELVSSFFYSQSSHYEVLFYFSTKKIWKVI